MCNDYCTNYQSDKFNCGACGHSCQGGDCTAGVCQPFTLATTSKAVNLALSSSAVLWTTGGSVASVPSGGGAVSYLSSNSSGCLLGLATDGTNAYSIDIIGNCTTTPWLLSGSLFSVPLSGGTKKTIDASAGGYGFPNQPYRCLAVDASNVYFTSFDIGYVLQVAKADGKETVLAGGVGTLGAGDPRAITVQGSFVYFADDDDGVRQVPIGGGSLVTLAPTQNMVIRYLATDSANLYYVLGGAVTKAAIAGSTPVTLVTSGATGPLAIDASRIYYLGASTVMSIAKTGGTAVTLASGQTNPVDIAVDATSVYWLTATQVMKIAK
ncbi:MAG TPA: hypothetical protein VFK05_10670 [Polyangiaceae bacterium]|nr:hypothetical protein [Polyangiaceae bacterium]